MIRNSFFSALFIFAISSALLTMVLYYWLHEPVSKCLVYAIPLSIMSSSIVIPSLHPLSQQKKEFLVYEASFSDILGILAFNYFSADDTMTLKSLGFFGISIAASVLLSIVLSLLLFVIMAKTKLEIKFFLIFSLLILIYAGGKLFHLPSLIIILVFGLMINNWEKIKWPRLLRYFPHEQVSGHPASASFCNSGNVVPGSHVFLYTVWIFHFPFLSVAKRNHRSWQYHCCRFVYYPHHVPAFFCAYQSFPRSFFYTTGFDHYCFIL